MTKRTRIQVVSPYRASATRSVEQHAAFASRLCRLAALAGYAPFAPHLLYPTFLDDGVPEERDAGIECSIAWLEAAKEIWVWDLWGLSDGMQRELREIAEAGILVLYMSKGQIAAWDRVDFNDVAA